MSAPMNGTPFQQNGQSEDEIDLREVWNILLRNRGLIFTCLFVVASAALAFALLSTPVYQATTSIRIDNPRPGLGVFDALQPLATRSNIGTEMEELRSRTLAEAVVDSLSLQLQLTTPRRVSRADVFDLVRVERTAPEAEYRFKRTDDGRFDVTDVTNEAPIGTFAPGERVPLPGAVVVLSHRASGLDEIEVVVVAFEKAVDGLRKSLEIRIPNVQANIVVARYESRDTMLVHQVPNALARLFIARRNEIKKTEARSTVDFLRDQIDTMTAQLAAAEDALRDFREGQQVVSLEAEASTQVQQLARLKAERDQLEAERAALAELLAQVNATASGTIDGEPSSAYRRLLAFPSILRNQAASELFRSLTAVENELSEVLRRRTMKDPDAQILAARIRDLEEQLHAIVSTYLQGLTDQIASLDATLARFATELERIPAKEVQFARLQRQTAVLEQIYTLLQTRLKEAEIAQAVEDISVRIVDPAVKSIEPVAPRKKLILAVGILLGLMLGTAIAFIREYMDTTVHTREDIQEATGLAVLGLIPKIRDVAAAARNGMRPGAAGGNGAIGLEARLVTGIDPRNPVSEAYRSLRTNITFARPDHPVKTLVFTSPAPGEGKSTTSANLAITLAQQGHRVLLIDADLRRGVMNTVFGVDREPGVSNVLLAGESLERAIREVDLGESGTLHFMPTGTLPPNPAELLGSERMRAFLEELEARFDMVILDAPPLNVVTDAALLGTNADGVILVSRAARTEKAALTFALEQLRNVRAPVLGAILNDIDYKRDAKYFGRYGSYGYYQYYYGTEDH